MQMQTPKSSTKSSSERVQKVSPRSVSSDATQRNAGRAVRQLKTTGLEPNSSSNQPSPRTQKTTSPKVIPEKRRVGRVAELESKISELEDALRTIKDQLILSESWKKQAKQDAEESRKEFLAMSVKLEESQHLLAQLSYEETHGVEELNDEHHDEADKSIKKPKSTDSTALTAALLEIDQLKVKLDTISESEATKTKNMAETLSLIEEMKNQLQDSKSSESQAQALASETLQQLETAKMTIQSLESTTSEYNTIKLELDESRADLNSLQERESEEIIALKSSEVRCREELNKSKEDIEELKANLMDKETELQAICEENENLNAKLASLISGDQENEIKRAKLELENLKSKLTNVEAELGGKSDENERLKVEIKKMEEKVGRVTEQLVAEQAAHGEKEAELRRLKVQMDQWRKAAEAATAMLCNGNNDNDNQILVERTWSMGNYSVDIDDDGDEFLKKKNGNMLRRIGVLWNKKPQNK